MRSIPEIEEKLRTVKFRHLQRLMRKRMKRRPCNCQFNREHTYTKEGKELTVRICMLGAERDDWDVGICDKTEQAKQCNAYLPLHTRESVAEEFESEIKDPDTLIRKHRDIYILGWVLGYTDVTLKWWQRINLWWQTLF